MKPIIIQYFKLFIQNALILKPMEILILCLCKKKKKRAYSKSNREKTPFYMY